MTAASANGCTDSAFTVLHIPPADNFRISIDSLDCAGEDSLHLVFTLCNDFKRGIIPKGLRVSFYDGDPSSSNARLLEPVFSTPDAFVSACASFDSFIFHSTTGKVFGLVNETGKNAVNFPGMFYEEAQYDNNGDTASVRPFLVRIIPADTTINRSGPVKFRTDVSGGYAISYQWEPVQDLSCIDCPGPVATPPIAVDYQLTVRNTYGCRANDKSYVKIFSGGRVNIPNGFSPNNDGHNDVFYILGSQDVKMLNDFSIYNRWGQKVFQVQHVEANDPRFGWQGLINGKPAEPGGYIYFVQVAFTDGTTEQFKGSIILVR